MAFREIKLKYDREITIATGASRKSTKWINSTMLWSELVARLEVPLRTQESISEYQRLPKAKRDVIKDVGGFVGGTLKGGRRLAENIAARDVLTLDLDSIPTGTEIWPLFEDVYDYAACMYSTHSHTCPSPRLRLCSWRNCLLYSSVSLLPTQRRKRLLISRRQIRISA